MDGHEPKMRNACLEHRVDALFVVEPVEEGFHLAFEAARCRSLIVDALAADRT